MAPGAVPLLVAFGGALAQGVTVFQNEWCFCIMPTIVPENPPSAASVAYAAAPLPGGGLLLAGTEPRPNPALGSGWRVTALDASGAVRWSRSLGWAEEFHEVARAAAAGPDGRVVVAGYAEHARGTPVPSRWLVAAYAPDGATLWTDEMISTQPQRAESVAVGPDGVTVVAGWRGAGPASGSHWIVRAHEPDGRLRWSRTLAGPTPGPSGARAAAVGADGRVVVAGNVMAGGAARSAWDVRAYAPDGALLWSRSLLAPDSWLDEPYSAAVAPDGRVAVAGKTSGPGGERANWTVTLLDREGRELWTRTRNGARGLDDKALAVVFDACGRVVAAGYEDGDTRQKPPFDAGHWMVRTYEANGDVAEERDLIALAVGPGGAYALAPVPGGALVVAGYEQEAEPGRTRWTVRRLDPPRCTAK